MKLGRRRGPRFDRPIVFDQLPAERRERRAAAPRAARLRRHHGRAKAAVHVVDQEPGAPIGHAERTAGPRDRAGFADRLEEADLARPKRPLRAEIDPHRQPHIAHSRTSRRARLVEAAVRLTSTPGDAERPSPLQCHRFA
jgi:hypothetical protein